MKSLFNRLTGKAVSRTAFVEHLGQEVIQHHPNWKVMISTDHKLMRIDTPLNMLCEVLIREQVISNLKQILPEVTAEIVDTGANDGKVAVRFMVLCLGDATLSPLLISGTILYRYSSAVTVTLSRGE